MTIVNSPHLDTANPIPVQRNPVVIITGSTTVENLERLLRLALLASTGRVSVADHTGTHTSQQLTNGVSVGALALRVIQWVALHRHSVSISFYRCPQGHLSSVLHFYTT